MLRVEDYFVYSPDTGEVVWSKNARGARCVPGRKVGTSDKNGYLTVKVMGTTWKVHRLIFLLMGEPLPEVVDHINGIPSDNRWCNLRAGTPLNNAHNRKAHRNNTSGFKGVTFDRGNIRAQITVRGKHYSKGGFKTVEDAAEWYQQMSSTLHGDFSEWTSRGLEPASA